MMPIGPRMRKRLRQPMARIAAGINHRAQLDLLTLDRGELVEVSQVVAVSVPAFMAHVHEADRHRDAANWVAAEAGYAAALELYPYQNGYWVQHGHMLKEQERFVEAEISYRTACAYGAPAHDIMEHLRFVMARQGLEEWRFPIRFYKPGRAAEQIPGRPDIDTLARLVWHVGGVAVAEIVDLLRRHNTCDELLAAMIGDPRFERGNRDWLSVVREGEL